MQNLSLVDENTIKTKIYDVRDLPELYEVELKRMNEQVKRNIERFPQNFRFQITEDEYQNLRSQNTTSSSNDFLRSQNATLENRRGRHSKYLPYVFTEQGVSMLSAVLKSIEALDMLSKIKK